MSADVRRRNIFQGTVLYELQGLRVDIANLIEEQKEEFTCINKGDAKAVSLFFKAA